MLAWSSCISEPMEQGQYGSKLSVGDTIPDFSVVTLDRNTVSRDNRKRRDAGHSLLPYRMRRLSKGTAGRGTGLS